MTDAELDPLDRIEIAALATFKRYGLLAEGWKFEFDSALKRYGICRHHDKTISLSRALVVMNTLSQSLDILLHEVAHALAGPEHGHDAVWRALASRLGARPIRCFDTCNPEVIKVQAAWTAPCKCDTPHTRHRKPQRLLLCAKCRTPLIWSPQ